jgi:hypothetical protein
LEKAVETTARYREKLTRREDCKKSVRGTASGEGCETARAQDGIGGYSIASADGGDVWQGFKTAKTPWNSDVLGVTEWYVSSATDNGCSQPAYHKADGLPHRSLGPRPRKIAQRPHLAEGHIHPALPRGPRWDVRETVT